MAICEEGGVWLHAGYERFVHSVVGALHPYKAHSVEQLQV